MVTKHLLNANFFKSGSVLAKILMVTKHMFNICLDPREFCSSKNPYGNKTKYCHGLTLSLFCSSKNPYGNKTL